MAFNSVSFFIFWFILIFLFQIVKKNSTIRTYILLAFNLLFFGMLSKYCTILLLTTTALDYLISIKIHATENDSKRFRWLCFSVLQNVLIILVFKHFNDWFELNNPESVFHFPIPLKFIGVSFLAFRSMGYVFDVYYENMDKPAPSLVSYWTYASFFPLILSGPISQAESFFQKMKDNEWIVSSKQQGKAIFLICLGIIKKFILGNYLAINFIDRVFDGYSFFTGLENLLAAILQTLALYLDFSGYTDLVVGLSLLLGFEIIENFNFPFLSQNITEYWKRWHISLSSWFNQFVYFPLSYYFRKLQKLGTALAVFIVFTISGFWHGTTLNFWLWGWMHAMALIWDIYSANTRLKIKKHIPVSIYKPISILLTFVFLTVSGIYFKASNLEIANGMISKIITDTQFKLISDWFNLYKWVGIIGIVVLIIQFTSSGLYQKAISFFESIHVAVLASVLVLIVFIAYQFNAMGSLPFYYLQF